MSSTIINREEIIFLFNRFRPLINDAIDKYQSAIDKPDLIYYDLVDDKMDEGLCFYFAENFDLNCNELFEALRRAYVRVIDFEYIKLHADKVFKYKNYNTLIDFLNQRGFCNYITVTAGDMASAKDFIFQKSDIDYIKQNALTPRRDFLKQAAELINIYFELFPEL